MWYRSLAALLVVFSVLPVSVRSEEIHDNWMKWLTGKWSWKSTDGNHGTVEFEPFRNAQAQTVKEYCENLNASALMTQGWRADTKTFGGAGFDSDGNYVETYFSRITETTIAGQRIRRSADGETKELWEATRKGDNRYDLVITIDGEAVTVVITRQ